MKSRIGTYRNGNVIVRICDDGTKYRYTPEKEIAAPEFPESIDLKITAFCEENCPMCQENAGMNGCHADLNHPFLDSIPAYTELAIGGGNPMAHPDLYSFLQRMKKQNVICNITVHYNQFMKSINTLCSWQNEGVLHGVGVSIHHPLEDTAALHGFPHIVVHTIAGVSGPDTYRSLADKDLDLLILGYKDFGRGHDYYKQNSNVERRIRWVADHVKDLSDHFRSICFDDLAVRQLDLKNKINPAVWQQFYMGGDGDFTMYVDLVRGEYAAFSTAERRTIFSDDIRDLFAVLQQQQKE